MGVLVKQPGVLTTVQDKGRAGYQSSGFNVSGCMDQKAFRIANILVGNGEEEAVLEMTLMGPSLMILADAVIAVTGGDLQPKLNEKPLPMYRAVSVKRGDEITFGFAKDGSRAYMAVNGGFSVPGVMGSKSTNLKCKIGGFLGRKLQANDLIPFASPKTALPSMESRRLEGVTYKEKETVLRVILGPQEDYFTEEGIMTFLSGEYTVTGEFDRMGCRLEGKSISYKNGVDIISDAIALGSVQVPSHGKPIIMLADRQTTGGYAKIATVISVDIPKLVQRSIGDKIRFQKVNVKQAQKLIKQEEREFIKLKRKIGE